MKRTTLIMFSGGLDSTACLVRLLERTNDYIYLHYVDVNNNKDKAWCEQKSRLAILDALKSVFPPIRFQSDETSEFGTPFGRQRGLSLQPAVWMIQAAIHLNGIIDEVKKGDKPSKQRLCLGYTVGDSATEDIELVKRTWFNIWRSVNVEDPVPELYTPILKVTKKQSLDYIRRFEQRHKGVNIVKHIWTCEFPERTESPMFNGLIPCRNCDSCKKSIELGLIDETRMDLLGLKPRESYRAYQEPSS